MKAASNSFPPIFLLAIEVDHLFGIECGGKDSYETKFILNIQYGNELTWPLHSFIQIL